MGRTPTHTPLSEQYFRGSLVGNSHCAHDARSRAARQQFGPESDSGLLALQAFAGAGSGVLVSGTQVVCRSERGRLTGTFGTTGGQPRGLLSDALARFERCAHERDGDVESAIADLRRYVNRGSWVRAGVLLSRVHKVLPELCTAKGSAPRLVAGHRGQLRARVRRRTHSLRQGTNAEGVNTVYGAVGPEPRSNKSVLYDGNLIASHLLQALPRGVRAAPVR